MSLVVTYSLWLEHFGHILNDIHPLLENDSFKVALGDRSVLDYTQPPLSPYFPPQLQVASLKQLTAYLLFSPMLQALKWTQMQAVLSSI